MARSINNGTGEIQIGTGGILEYPTNAYLRRSFSSLRTSLVALLVPRSTITRLRTDERVCATATVSTPFSPRQNPFFHGWNMWEGGGGRPPRGIILNYVCPRLVTGRSSQPNRALFLRSSPLSTFAGSFPPFPVSGVTHSSRSTVHTHTETILRFETLVVVSKNAPRRSSIHHLLPSLSSLPILRFNGRNIFGNSWGRCVSFTDHATAIFRAINIGYTILPRNSHRLFDVSINNIRFDRCNHNFFFFFSPYSIV